MATFVETWKGIAFALGRSERWCRYMARRTDDPLPVFKIGGIVRLNTEDLESWVARHRDRALGANRAKPRAPTTDPSAAHLQLIA